MEEISKQTLIGGKKNEGLEREGKGRRTGRREGWRKKHERGKLSQKQND